MGQIFLVGLIGLVTSFLSNISGGGGSMILLPLLMAIGLSPLTAIGTNKLGAVGLVLGTAFGTKGKAVVRKDYLKQLLLIVAAASIIGPYLVLKLPQNQVKILSSLLIVVTAIASLLTWKIASKARQVSQSSKYLGYFLFFIGAGVLAGLGSAIGLLNGYILIGLLGMSPLETISTRRITGIIGTPLQLLAFAATGYINLKLGLALLFGSAIGGYLGLNSAIKLGDQFIKRAMAVVAIILVISLFV